MHHTFDVSQLSDIATLQKQTQALAILDAIISPEWDMRYYSYNSVWSPNEQMASMRNGSGDLWFLLFCSAGAALHALAHDAETFTFGKPTPGIFNNLPLEFQANFLHEAAFDTNNSTFACWRRASDTQWSRGNNEIPNNPDADGSIELLSILLGRPEQYVNFVSEYYERDIALADVSAIYKHSPLTPALVARLNPKVTIESLQHDIQEIGYPEIGLTR